MIGDEEYIDGVSLTQCMVALRGHLYSEVDRLSSALENTTLGAGYFEEASDPT